MGTEVIQLTRFTKTLLALIGTAFLSWAGVVWQTGNEVSEAADDVRSRLSRLEAKIDTYSGLLRAHEAQPWHETAGQEIKTLRKELKP